MKSNEINIRDPYILPYDGKYYLYGTRSETAFVGQAYGFDVYVSDDLENGEGPFGVRRAIGLRKCIVIRKNFICLRHLQISKKDLGQLYL